MPRSNITAGQQQFAAFVFLAQMQQAEAIAAHTKQYRKSASCKLDSSGLGMTAGALYWQLDDIWPTISWASIDFLGHLKPLHYAMERLFRHEVLVSHVAANSDVLHVYYVNDHIPQLRKSVRSLYSNKYVYVYS